MYPLNAANRAHTTLNGAINASVTSIVVTDASVFSDPPFRAVISAGSAFEIVEVTAIATNTLTVATRGSLAFPDDTTAASWDSGAVIAQEQTAGYAQLIAARSVAGGNLMVDSPTTQWFTPGHAGGGTANTAPADGVMEYSPIMIDPQHPSVDAVGGFIHAVRGSQSSDQFRVGLYRWSNGTPGALLYDWGLVTAHDTEAGIVWIKTFATLTLTPGPYFVALVATMGGAGLLLRTSSNANLATHFTAFSNTQGAPLLSGHLTVAAQGAQVSGGLSDPAVTPTDADTLRPYVWFRAV